MQQISPIFHVAGSDRTYDPYAALFLLYSYACHSLTEEMDTFINFISLHATLILRDLCSNYVLMTLSMFGTTDWNDTETRTGRYKQFQGHGVSGCEKSEDWVLLATVSLSDHRHLHCENNSFLDPLPPPTPFTPKAPSVAALHLHVENFVTQYTHIHVTTTTTRTTSITSLTPGAMCSAPPLASVQCFPQLHASQANEAPIYAQFILQYTKSQNQLFQLLPIPLLHARTLQQFSWSQTQFASPFKGAPRSFKVERSRLRSGPCIQLEDIFL